MKNFIRSNTNMTREQASLKHNYNHASCSISLVSIIIFYWQLKSAIAMFFFIEFRHKSNPPVRSHYEFRIYAQRHPILNMTTERRLFTWLVWILRINSYCMYTVPSLFFVTFLLIIKSIDWILVAIQPKLNHSLIESWLNFSQFVATIVATITPNFDHDQTTLNFDRDRIASIPSRFRDWAIVSMIIDDKKFR